MGKYVERLKKCSEIKQDGWNWTNYNEALGIINNAEEEIEALRDNKGYWKSKVFSRMEVYVIIPIFVILVRTLVDILEKVF